MAEKQTSYCTVMPALSFCKFKGGGLSFHILPVSSRKETLFLKKKTFNGFTHMVIDTYMYNRLPYSFYLLNCIHKSLAG